MSQELDVDARLRLALRILGWVGTTMWAGFWLTWGLVMAAISSTTAGMLMAGLACLPCLPFWIFEVRRYRRARRPAAPVPVPPDPTPVADASRQWLPPEVGDEWRRLEQARDLVVGFADEGWVDPAALAHVDEHMARLERLLVADARLEQLGGTSSATLRRQVEELGALLVALADEAVEHQASLASDDPVPVTLAEARDRLATTTAAYRELHRPGQVRGLQHPG